MGILTTLLVLVSSGLAGCVYLNERHKRRFVARVHKRLASVAHVDSGDVSCPLSFTLGDTRVSAVLRGRCEVWHLERTDPSFAVPGVFAVVQEGWRAHETRCFAAEGAVTPRLGLYSTSSGRDFALHLVRERRGDLCHALGREARRLVVEPGRVFLEVDRRALDLDQLGAALARLQAVVDVVEGRPPRLLPAAGVASSPAVAGPGGALVPAFVGAT